SSGENVIAMNGPVAARATSLKLQKLLNQAAAESPLVSTPRASERPAAPPREPAAVVSMVSRQPVASTPRVERPLPEPIPVRQPEPVVAVEPEALAEPVLVVEPALVVEPEIAAEPEAIAEPEIVAEPELPTPVSEPIVAAAEPEPVIAVPAPPTADDEAIVPPLNG